MKARNNMKVYYRGNVYVVTINADCKMCSLYNRDTRSCAGICSRFENFPERFVLTYFSPFVPSLFKEIVWTSKLSQLQCYEDHQRELDEYYNTPAGGLCKAFGLDGVGRGAKKPEVCESSKNDKEND